MNEASFDKRRLASLSVLVQDVIDDDEFWRLQAKSPAILATPDHIHTFRLANRLVSLVQVWDRFQLKPVLRAMTFPRAGFVMALSHNGARLVDFAADGPPVQVRVDDMPRDAGSAAGRAPGSVEEPTRPTSAAVDQSLTITCFRCDMGIRPGDRGRPPRGKKQV